MASVINQIQLGTTTYAVAASAYAECATAAGTQAKIANICTGGDTSSSLGTFTLLKGVAVQVKFTNTNSSTNPTLNVNNTGAKAIYYNGTNISANYLKANHTYTFVYTIVSSGTEVWALVGDVVDPSLSAATNLENITLTEDIWTDKTIGHIAGTSTSPKKVASTGDNLKTMFTNIFGAVTDDTTNLVTPPSISSVSIGKSTYEYGTKLSSVSVTVTPVAGSYKYGPSSTGSTWTGKYTLSGTGFTTKNDSEANTQTVSLSSQFTVGTSTSRNLTAMRSYTSATTTAKSKLQADTTQTIAAGTASKVGVFNPTAQYSVYWATSTTTATPTTWTLYDPDGDGVGQTSVEDLLLTCGKDQYLWIASHDASTSCDIYAVNQASGQYNESPISTTATSGSITNSQGVEVTYNLFRTTTARSIATTNKFKLA